MLVVDTARAVETLTKGRPTHPTGGGGLAPGDTGGAFVSSLCLVPYSSRPPVRTGTASLEYTIFRIYCAYIYRTVYLL